MQMIQTSLPKH